MLRRFDFTVLIFCLDGQTSDAILRKLSTTTPRDDKTRIKREKEPLMDHSCDWVFRHPDYRKWWKGDDSTLLWVKGDPGKGKTMLLCGIIEWLEHEETDCNVIYFFCQATNPRLDNARAVLRALLWDLSKREPHTRRRVLKAYEESGERLFEDANSWDALSSILITSLQQDSLRDTYIILDALDECRRELEELLSLIESLCSTRLVCKIRILVSSRNVPEVENGLKVNESCTRFSLEVNENAVSAVVNKYIEHKVNVLTIRKKYSPITKQAVVNHLCSNAHGTFLWVSLVCKELEKSKVLQSRVLTTLKSFPPGLNQLYKIMVERINSSEDIRALCWEILAAVSLAFRPLRLAELPSLGPGEALSDLNASELREIVDSCGSFLIHDDAAVSFVHTSAKDFLMHEGSGTREYLFPGAGIPQHHCILACRCVETMRYNLFRNDLYNLGAPMTECALVQIPDPDPLLPSRYACMFWLRHLLHGLDAPDLDHLNDEAIVHKFFATHLLRWFEAMSLLKRIPTAGPDLAELHRGIQQRRADSKLGSLFNDAARVAFLHAECVSNFPLQVYSSVLLFSPRQSLVRALYEDTEPTWLSTKPAVQEDWNSVPVFTIQGARQAVFSADGTKIATLGPGRRTISIWDAVLGRCLNEFQTPGPFVFAHFSTMSVRSKAKVQAAFIVGTSGAEVVFLWDSTTQQCHMISETRKGKQSPGSWGWGLNREALVFSPDGSLLAVELLGLGLEGIRIVDVALGRESAHIFPPPIPEKKGWVETMAFSPKNTLLAASLVLMTSAEMERKWAIRCLLWDMHTGRCLDMTREQPHASETMNPFESALALAFSPDETLVAFGLGDSRIFVYETATGSTVGVFVMPWSQDDPSNAIIALQVAADGYLFVASRESRHYRLWDLASDRCLFSCSRHAGPGQVVVSPDLTRLITNEARYHSTATYGSRRHSCNLEVRPFYSAKKSSTIDRALPVIDTLHLSVDGTKAALTRRLDSSCVEVRSIDTTTSLVLGEWQFSCKNEYELLSSSGNILAVVSKCCVYLTETWTRPLVECALGGQLIDSAIFDPDGHRLVLLLSREPCSGTESVLWAIDLQGRGEQGLLDGLTARPYCHFEATCPANCVTEWLARQSTEAYVHKLLNMAKTRHLQASPDGRLMAIASTSGVVGVWDMRNAKNLWVAYTRSYESKYYPPELGRHFVLSDGYRSAPSLILSEGYRSAPFLRFSPDGRFIACQPFPERPWSPILLLDAMTGRRLREVHKEDHFMLLEFEWHQHSCYGLRTQRGTLCLGTAEDILNGDSSHHASSRDLMGLGVSSGYIWKDGKPSIWLPGQYWERRDTTRSLEEQRQLLSSKAGTLAYISHDGRLMVFRGE